MEITVISVILCLFSALVVVQSQTAPYISFMGHHLSNHSYVNLSQVGRYRRDSVRCHTDLVTCCSAAQGQHRGNWYYPNGTRLSYPGDKTNLAQIRGDQEVELYRYQGNMASGVYRCDIETNNGNQETVFAGLYYSGGGVMILDDMQLSVDIDFFGVNPQYTLTCISIGGPATTVTWTRDSMEISGGMSVLHNTVNAQYTHTLTVTGRLPGRYNCTVSNNKPSSANKSFTVQVASPPTNLMVVQENATSIRVSWTPPTPLGYTSGYKIYYRSGSNGSVDVSGGSTDSYLLNGLHSGASYTISIVGKLKHFPSEHVHFLGSIPLDDSSQNIRSCNNAGTIGGGTVGGFVGGVLLTIVIGTAIHLVFLRRVRTAAIMRCSCSKAAKEQKRHIPTSNNEAYGQVKMDKGDTGYEMCDTSSGVARAAQESTYETVAST